MTMKYFGIHLFISKISKKKTNANNIIFSFYQHGDLMLLYILFIFVCGKLINKDINFTNIMQISQIFLLLFGYINQSNYKYLTATIEVSVSGKLANTLLPSKTNKLD